MSISVFDLFSIGLGPSSSHTVGPMKAACTFVKLLPLENLHKIKVELFGSLAYTGKGHGTHAAILMGLEGQLPDAIDPSFMPTRVEAIHQTQQLNIAGEKNIPFNVSTDFVIDFKTNMPLHSNAMRFTALNTAGEILLQKVYYSIGGGFIIDEHQQSTQQRFTQPEPYPFNSAHELLAHCQKNNKTISEIMMANESAFRSEADIRKRLLLIDEVMAACIDRGCKTNEKILPGGLNIKRRAAEFYKKLILNPIPKTFEHTDSQSWLNLYALAVNEENAAGGRVVTAPTNGAAGIIPAVLNYYKNFYPQANEQGVIDFLLTAGAIAILYKKNASISGAEVGCQGEVGVASSMAAAALTAVRSGTITQVENAAEIAMEHHLGMTCDPIGGLVQIPCIERNAMGSVKAVNASLLAMIGDGQHHVSLDKVIATMRQTGKDMMTIYKETSIGGLAANLPEC